MSFFGDWLLDEDDFLLELLLDEDDFLLELLLDEDDFLLELLLDEDNRWFELLLLEALLFWLFDEDFDDVCLFLSSFRPLSLSLLLSSVDSPLIVFSSSLVEF
ncbi:MAG: hypothetical protein SNG34_01625 [Rikenellaceae bacterium]